MSEENRQFSTFFIGERLYGIDVMRVQEVVKSLPITKIPLAPAHVHGLINLRGQIATAIGLRELFLLKEKGPEEQMNVVCHSDGVLISLLVDRIGDVVEVNFADFEPTPDTISEGVRKFMAGVYKMNGPILSIIEIDKIMKTLNQQNSNEN